MTDAHENLHHLVVVDRSDRRTTPRHHAIMTGTFTTAAEAMAFAAYHNQMLATAVLGKHGVSVDNYIEELRSLMNVSGNYRWGVYLVDVQLGPIIFQDSAQHRALTEPLGHSSPNYGYPQQAVPGGNPRDPRLSMGLSQPTPQFDPTSPYSGASSSRLPQPQNGPGDFWGGTDHGPQQKPDTPGENCAGCGRHYTVTLSISPTVWKKIEPKMFSMGDLGRIRLCASCLVERLTNANVPLPVPAEIHHLQDRF